MRSSSCAGEGINGDVPPPAAVVAKSESTPAWQIVIQVAGAAAGLATFLYLVGAITVWIRLRTAGYPADTGLSLMSKGTVVGVGVRGVVIVTVVLGPILLFARWYLRHEVTEASGSHIRRPILEAIAAILVVLLAYRLGITDGLRLGSLVLVASATAMLQEVGLKWFPKSPKFWPMAIAAIAGVVLAAFVSWRGLGVACVALAVAALVAHSRERASFPLWPLLVLTVIVIEAVLLAHRLGNTDALMLGALVLVAFATAMVRAVGTIWAPKGPKFWMMTVAAIAVNRAG